MPSGAAGVPLPVPGLAKPKAKAKPKPKALPKPRGPNPRSATPKARAVRAPKPRTPTGRAPAARAAAAAVAAAAVQDVAATYWAVWPEERHSTPSVSWAPFADGAALGALVRRVRGLAAVRVALRTVGAHVTWTWRVGDALPAELAPGAVVALA